MGRPLNAINEMVNGKKSITAEAALQFEEVMPEIPRPVLAESGARLPVDQGPHRPSRQGGRALQGFSMASRLRSGGIFSMA
jgi:hypothetical protein